MSVPKHTCYRPSAFPLPYMTDSADVHHIEASFYHTSVCVCVCVLSQLQLEVPRKYLSYFILFKKKKKKKKKKKV